MARFSISSRAIINPFYIYIYINIFTILLYSFKWSELLPELSTELIFFFFLTGYVMLFIGFLLSHSALLPRYKPICITHTTSIVVFLLIVLISFELISNGGIPLLMILSGVKYDYSQFGIKTLHVFILPFVSFYTVYLFHLFNSTKNKKILFQAILLLCYPVLIMNRGAWLITLTAIILVSLMSMRSIKLKNIFILLVVIISLLFIFGNLGDIRQRSEGYFVSISQPSEEFQESNIPEVCLWSYMYITSPLGNLQSTIDQRVDESLSGFIFSSMIPDFISKHFDVAQNPVTQISPFFNVGGIYARAYANMGWLGMITTFIYLTVFIIVYLIFLPRNTPYTISGVALISTLVVFCIFNNMIIFSGFSLQLVFPILLGLFFKRKCLK
jgi:oligosaccharide repeat unit polymerase